VSSVRAEEQVALAVDSAQQVRKLSGMLADFQMRWNQLSEAYLEIGLHCHQLAIILYFKMVLQDQMRRKPKI
jgi:hypothetical protein